VKNWLKVRFITGFFVTVPAIATAWLLYVFWDAIDNFFSPGYERIFGRRIPGLGFLTAIALILVMGTIATNVVGRRILAQLGGHGHSDLFGLPCYRGDRAIDLRGFAGAWHRSS